MSLPGWWLQCLQVGFGAPSLKAVEQGLLGRPGLHQCLSVFAPLSSHPGPFWNICPAPPPLPWQSFPPPPLAASPRRDCEDRSPFSVFLTLAFPWTLGRAFVFPCLSQRWIKDRSCDQLVSAKGRSVLSVPGFGALLREQH